MNDHQKELASKMLEAYSHMLAMRGCNDYPMEDTPENREIERLVIEWGRDPEAEPCTPGNLCLSDWAVAAMLAEQIKSKS